MTHPPKIPPYVEVLIDWYEDQDEDGPCYIADVETEEGETYELRWSEEDPDHIIWAEYADRRVYGTSGCDTLSEFLNLVVR